METTGNSIRYFAVDTRMFPFSAQVTGIFYAPATLSDHRIENNAPIDFYEIKAVSEFGTEFAVDEIPPGTTITDYKLIYKDMFYNSMFYRTFAGYSGRDLGLSEGIPGLTEDMAQQQIMPAWGMEHFRVVYRTSYYNPYPPADVQNHTQDWRAINFEDAVELQRKIQDGSANGTIDPSSRSTLTNGVVIIKYYHGAYVNGTITIDGTTPFSDVTVTVSDEFGIPHHSTKTDSEGRYSVLAPFGNNLTLSASIGQVNNLTKQGATVLVSHNFNITDDQAMRVPHDRDGNGILDYIITNNFEIRGGSLNGKAFMDLNGNGALDPSDKEVSGSELTLIHTNVGTTLEGTSNAIGEYEFSNIFPGDYELTVKTHGREFSGFTTTVKAGEASALDLNITSHTLKGRVLKKTMDPVEADVFLYDVTNGTTIVTKSNSTGFYEYKGLLYGDYSLKAETMDLSSLPTRVSLTLNTTTKDVALTVFPSGHVKGSAYVENDVAAYAPLKFTSYDGTVDELMYADSNGRFEVTLPEGTYSIHSSYYLDGTHYVHLSSMEIERNRTTTKDLMLEESAKVEGVTYLGSANNTIGRTAITFEDMNGNGRIGAVSSNSGAYSAMLPKRSYHVKVTKGHHHMGTMALNNDMTLDIPLQQGEIIEGVVYYDLNKNEIPEGMEGIEGVNMVLMDSKSRRIDVYADSGGAYDVALDGNETYSITIDIHGYDPYASGPLNISELHAGSNIRLIPSNVTLSGTVIYKNASLTDLVPIRFAPKSIGAIEAMVTTMPTPSGTYEVSLMPGEYEINIDHEIAPGEKYQNIDKSLLEVKIGDENRVVDIEVLKEFQLTGNFVLAGVDPSELIGTYVAFKGPEDTEFSTNDTFSIFLTEGVYSMRAAFVYAAENYMNISEIDLNAPANMEFELEGTEAVEGFVLYDGVSIGDMFEIVFEKSTGGSTSINASSSGHYMLTLPDGEYVAKVNHTRTETTDALRFVRYSSSTDFLVSEGGTLNLDMDLIRTLNNATITGKVYDSGNTTIAADLEFIAIDSSAINTTIRSETNGDFTMTIHPGNYTIYAVLGKDAYLGNVNAVAEENLRMDIRLLVGHRLEGTIYKDLVPVSGELSVENRSMGTRIIVKSDATGKFNVTLPTATYDITSRSTVLERGIQVPYANFTRVELSDDKIVKIELKKANNYNVEVSWDSSERRKIHGNETVVYKVTVRNTGNEPDSYVMAGEPGDWRFEFTPSVVSMNYGDSDSSRTVDVRITSPPNALVNHEPLIIHAKSMNSSAEGTVDVEIDIYPYLGIELSVSNETPVYNNSRMQYTVEILNTGNDDDNYTLLIANIDEIEMNGWKAYFNSSGVFTDSTTVTISPNTMTTIKIEIEAGHDIADLTILAYSEKDRGTDDVITIQLSLPQLLLGRSEVDVEGERLTLTPPDNLMANILIAMIFATIICIIALLVMRRKRK
jgi:dolichyl-diphosphooligosaccharide--protein glycosyltransferase